MKNLYAFCKSLKINLFILSLALGLHLPTIAQTYTVTNTNDSGASSLRQGILDVNSGLADIIQFDIAGAGPHTIQLLSDLNPIFQTVDLNATTQTGYTASTPQIVLDGVGATFGFALLTNSSGSQISGFVMGNFGNNAIHAQSTNNHTISNNFIGIAADGSTPFPNGRGINLESSANNSISNNIISGNSAVGLLIQNVASTNNTVTGNLIGTNSAGSVAVSNNDNIVIANAPNNIIGGLNPADRNIISGALDGSNQGEGININGSSSAGNQVIGNYIGTDINGTSSIQNAFAGILLIAGANANSILNNVIAGNYDANFNARSGVGIQIDGVGTDNNIIKGNLIGLDATGTSALPNRSGMDIQGGPDGTIIGGNGSGDGNIISGNNNSGIEIGNPVTENTNNNVIKGNLIGLNQAGTSAVPNLVGITMVFTNNTIIGGTDSGSRNYISGNTDGIRVFDSPNNTVLGNYIGLKLDGTAQGNSSRGIWIDGTNTTGNTIGGTTSGSQNIISGNGSYGLYISGNASSNTVAGNFIGTNLDGTTAFPNNSGILIFNANSNTIGGNTTTARNIISGNSSRGIFINGTSSTNNILGNYIGTNASGTSSLPNSTGIELSGNNHQTNIGGTLSNQGNLISGNSGRGILLINSDNNIILNNKIGVQADGVSALGNTSEGIFMYNASDGNTIGGLNSGEANTIAYNLRAVLIATGPPGSSQSINNKVSGNRIFANTSFGIDLEVAGITANDVNDPDTGSNNLQNFPVIVDNATFDGSQITLHYFVDCIPLNANPGYSLYPITIEFFIDDGNRQGKDFLYSEDFLNTDFTNGPSKQISFSLPGGSSFTVGNKITATATDANGNTSEFGAFVTVVDACTNPTTYYVDSDGDGFGVDDPETNIVDCTDPGSGYSTTPGDNCPNLSNPNQEPDADCDGVPTDVDCDDSDPSITTTNTNDADCDGIPTDVDCDDSDASITTTNTNDADCDGVIDSEDCAPNDATNTNSNVNDADCDGVPTDVDCDDSDPSITTTNVNDADCDGVPTDIDCDDSDPSITTTNVNDADCDGVPTDVDCDDSDASITTTNVNDADCDGVPTDVDCDDNDASITTTNVNDADCDGVPTDVDCDDSDASITTTNTNDADCDGVPTDVDCDDSDASITTTNVNDADCDGVPTDIDCDDSDASITTTNVNDADCDGVPTDVDCDDSDPSITTTNVNDADCDGVPTDVDCDDSDPSITTTNTNDADCDGVPTDVDCDDSDASITTTNTNDADCDGVPTDVDCDDNDASITTTNVNDADCDGVPTDIDCDDSDASITTTNVNDADCDGVPTDVDCDDSDPSITTTNVNDADCDGVPTDVDCDDSDASITTTNVNDADCDGVPTDVDCDDNDPNVTTSSANDSDNDTVNDCLDECLGSDDRIDADGDNIPDGCDSCIDVDDDGACADLDCNDDDPSIYPGAIEIPDDGIDQDCDGQDATTGDGYYGCTPGFWKNTDTWCGTYTRSMIFFEEFEIVDYPNNLKNYDHVSLQEALDLKGGGFNKLIRHATAALLNACHNGVNYPYTTDDILSMVQQVFQNGNKAEANALGDMFEVANQAGCPIDNSHSVKESPSIYPNPIATEGFWLKYSASKESHKFKAIIYDLNGSKLAEKDFQSDYNMEHYFWAIDHRIWDEGIYVLQLVEGDTKYYIRLIK